MTHSISINFRFKFGPSFEDQEKGLATPKGISPRIQKVFDYLMQGNIITKDEASFIIHPLTNGDYFRVCADFDDYVLAQQQMEETWKDKEEWTTRSIMTVSGMGKFSSDNALLWYIHMTHSMGCLTSQRDTFGNETNPILPSTEFPSERTPFLSLIIFVH